MIRIRGIIILLIAIAIGYLAAVLVSWYIEKKTRLEKEITKEVAKEEVAKIVVASKDIPMATKITSGDLKVINWPRESVPKGSFSKIDDLRDRVTKTKIFEGEPIIEARLVPKGEVPGLPALIPKGERAVAMRVSDVSGVAGFIHPGDMVDVISVMRVGEETVSKTILQNVKVLGVGTEIEEAPGKKPKKVNTVTLLLSPKNAEKLTLAAQAGRLRLALRSFSDKEVKERPGITLRNLIARKKRPSKRETIKIEVIKGNRREIKEFSWE